MALYGHKFLYYAYLTFFEEDTANAATTSA